MQHMMNTTERPAEMAQCETGSVGRNRTGDLLVMSQASNRCSTTQRKKAPPPLRAEANTQPLKEPAEHPPPVGLKRWSPPTWYDCCATTNRPNKEGSNAV